MYFGLAAENTARLRDTGLHLCSLPTMLPTTGNNAYKGDLRDTGHLFLPSVGGSRSVSFATLV